MRSSRSCARADFPIRTLCRSARSQRQVLAWRAAPPAGPAAAARRSRRPRAVPPLPRRSVAAGAARCPGLRSPRWRVPAGLAAGAPPVRPAACPARFLPLLWCAVLPRPRPLAVSARDFSAAGGASRRVTRAHAAAGWSSPSLRRSCACALPPPSRPAADGDLPAGRFSTVPATPLEFRRVPSLLTRPAPWRQLAACRSFFAGSARVSTRTSHPRCARQDLHLLNLHQTSSTAHPTPARRIRHTSHQSLVRDCPTELYQGALPSHESGSALVYGHHPVGDCFGDIYALHTTMRFPSPMKGSQPCPTG